MNQGWIYREQVDGANAGLTILAYFTHRYRHSSQTVWQSRIICGEILLDDQQTTADTLLKPGQWLSYHRPPWEEPVVPLTFEVLYQDADVWVVAKPAGLPVLPGGGFLEHTLLWQLQQQYPQETPVPIHRLGRGTSGLLLLARSPLARVALSEQMRHRQICKTYRALVKTCDLPLKDTFTITQPIGKIPHPVLGYVYGAVPDGRFAQSDCQVLKRRPETTLLAVTIRTGRPHQIRIHLAAAGCPLVADPLYEIGGLPRCQPKGAEKLPVPGDCGYYLHAFQLDFIHPRTHQPLSILCPAPVVLDESESVV
ncbi:pseudouridine synthase [Neosynechococcus sphagnicola sy1]|uniref:Pseudouridine synthase n=1 Tax=Neosynechococcus sphagnicola sy1 TaxID=1497020 RepID=A0A098TJR4_9CYAN|nr:RluA family pseudouridine synthase [Neosynechococcus sphagnicola]KGF72526.1 pseudouridine synthase [Neosynechococcus sphagnicola sy1]